MSTSTWKRKSKDSEPRPLTKALTEAELAQGRALSKRARVHQVDYSLLDLVKK